MQLSKVSAPQRSVENPIYFNDLHERVQRSEVLGSSTLKDSHIELLYDSRDGKFTLVEQVSGLEQVTVYDCVTRAQWDRNIMLFGHNTPSGKYMASGRATLDQQMLKVKLTSRRLHCIAVDATLPQLQPFVYCPDQNKTAPAKSIEISDLTQTDLRRLRGELSFTIKTSRVRRPACRNARPTSRF
jgi:hypothetical protein